MPFSIIVDGESPSAEDLHAVVGDSGGVPAGDVLGHGAVLGAHIRGRAVRRQTSRLH